MPLADRLRGLSCVVTGGANGIGAAVVRRLADEGARVVILDRDDAAARALGAEVGAVAAPLDLTDFEAVRAVIATHGPFDVAVSNAGVDQHAFFTRTTQDDWRRLLAINLEAAFCVTHAVLPAMQASGFGRLVMVGSEAGRLGSRGGGVDRAAAKGGLIAFAKSLAMENARYGITVNTVLPGPVDTPLLRRAVADGGEKLLHAMEASTLLNRLGRPEEVAAAVAFLASREAGFVTGETLGVSGGMPLA